MITRKIGEIIEYGGYRYRVEEDKGRQCGGCCFYYKSENECLLSTWNMPQKDIELFGHCGSGSRSDGKDVVFVNIGEIEK